MALVRWEPRREATSLQNEMNRLFGAFFDTPTVGRGAADGTFRRWNPAMDIVETDDHYLVRADLPGLGEGDVSVEVDDRVLKIAGERKREQEVKDGGYYRYERASGAFARTITLPEGVDAEAIAATFDKGVLEIKVPKPEERKPRKVQITVGDQPAAIEA